MSLKNVGSTIATAGLVHRVDGESTNECLNHPRRPVTPHNIKIHRKTFFGPGQRHVHSGLVNDMRSLDEKRSTLSKSERTFGISTNDSLHVDNVFAHGPQTMVAAVVNSNLERTYKSRNKGLGQVVSHGHKLPEKVLKKDFRFGIVKKEQEYNAKTLVYPHNNDVLSQETIAMLKKSHGTYEPGEQLKRNYDWQSTKLNPTVHRFGKCESLIDNGAARCLDEGHNPFRQDTKIISKKTTDHRRTQDKLGQCRDLGIGRASQNHVFGIKSDILGEWGAADCIRGDYKVAEQMPDGNLGRSTRPGYRNINITNRTFGCPTIRTDIAVPRTRSVADNQNYGTDANAKDLLYPCRFNSIGVSDKDFVDGRSPQDIREIFEAIGCRFTDDVFARLWWRASFSNDWNKDGAVSVEEFRAAKNEVENLKASGNQKPAWWEEAGKWAAQAMSQK